LSAISDTNDRLATYQINSTAASHITVSVNLSQGQLIALMMS